MIPTVNRLTQLKLKKIFFVLFAPFADQKNAENAQEPLDESQRIKIN